MVIGVDWVLWGWEWWDWDGQWVWLGAMGAMGLGLVGGTGMANGVGWG